MRVHKTQPTVFKGKEKILEKQNQYIKALDDMKQAKTEFAKDVNKNIVLIYWKQLCDLIEKFNKGK